MNKRKRAIGAMLVVTLVAVLCVGCPSSAYHSAVVAEHDFSTALKSFQQAEILEFQNGRIDQVEHQKIEAGVEKVGLAAQVLVGSLQSGAANTTVQQNFATLSAAVADLMNSGVLGIKNAQSQQLVKLVLQTAQAILSNISSLLAAPTTTTSTTKGGR
jgi:hypothetical protein